MSWKELENLKRDFDIKGIPTLRVGKVFLRAIEVWANKAPRTTGNTVRMVEKVDETTREALKVPDKDARIASEVDKVVEVGYGTVVTVDQATNRVHKALNEASNDQVEMQRVLPGRP